MLETTADESSPPLRKAATGTSEIMCARTESSKRCGDAGYLHRLTDRPRLWAPRRVTIPPRTAPPDLTALATEYQRAAPADRVTALAAELGVSVSLRGLPLVPDGTVKRYQSMSLAEWDESPVIAAADPS